MQKKDDIPAGLNHFDKTGNAIMVDVSGKGMTHRRAAARGAIRLSRAALAAVQCGTAAKGDVLGVARVAGIMAAKRTSGLIPLCHPLALTRCAIDFAVDEPAGEIAAICTAETIGQTGVEMEALTGACTALLTIYDMCKAIDRGMVITEVRLLEKQGGRHDVGMDKGARNEGNTNH